MRNDAEQSFNEEEMLRELLHEGLSRPLGETIDSLPLRIGRLNWGCLECGPLLHETEVIRPRIWCGNTVAPRNRFSGCRDFGEPSLDSKSGEEVIGHYEEKCLC